MLSLDTYVCLFRELELHFIKLWRLKASPGACTVAHGSHVRFEITYLPRSGAGSEKGNKR